MDETERLFQHYQATEVPFHQSLTTEPWGATGFIVLDSDENLTLFAGAAD